MGQMAAIDTAGPRVQTPARTAPNPGNGRAYLAVALIIGYHVAALAVVAGGIALSAAELVAHPGSIKAIDLLPAAVSAFVLLTLRPYGRGFKAPGPRLMPGVDDGVFRVIDQVTADTRKLPFHELYLAPSGDAEVFQREGRFGVGGRRTLVVGFALARVLSTEQFRALVVHEYARYYGGSRFGSYVERRRLSMQRGLAELGARRSALTALPFVLYSNFFIAATHALSRRQVLEADGEAARIAGPDAMTGAIEALAAAPAALDAYVQVWSTGRRTPFSEYLRKYETKDRMAMAVAYRTRVAPTDPGEVPPAERIKLLNSLEPSEPYHDEPAARLFSGLEERERIFTVELATKRAVAE